jgi:hypothetical protein
MDNFAKDLVSFGESAFLMTLKDGSEEKRVPTDEPFFMFRGYTFHECEGADFWNLSDTEYHYLLKYSDLG